MNSLSEASLTTVEKVEHHPQADRLDLIQVYGAPVIVGRDEFKVGDEVVFIPFDSVLNHDENFPPSARGKRVKPAKIRGVFSMGLALKNKWSLTATDNVNEKLGITKYEWKSQGSNDGDGLEIAGPKGLILPSKYDLHSLRECHNYLIPGEIVGIMEKTHGSFMIATVHNGEFFVGSRNRWLGKDDKNQWWRLAQSIDLENRLKSDPKMDGIMLMNEVYGSNVQDMTYGAKPGELKYAGFDVYNAKTGKFADYEVMKKVFKKTGLPIAPELYHGPWTSFDEMKPLAEQDSRIGGSISEGFVVRSNKERYTYKGRVIYKIHSERFLTRK